ncbi:lysine-specific demethylase 4A-like isoform X4 [Babylonia areolata]|uniref:lysine-specific demethylase 4A-like isoform X4 n=1 Tax=Babylonia areolata TaxID=304850 RepID=UPI003FD04939
MESSSGGTQIPKIMVFRPTMDEFKDFNRYIRYIESQGAHKAGLAKIIPPAEWVPRKAGYDNIDIQIPAPIEQVVQGCQGLYTQYNIQRKSMHVSDFKKLASSEKYQTPKHFDYEELERKYWKNAAFGNAIYGADISGSLTDSEQDVWNINRLGSILDYVAGDYGIKIEGVNTAYLYFGMWKTTFAWHTEDMDLYSINYLHFGAPKSWYTVPPEHGQRLERLAQGFFPGSFQACPAFLRHKMTLISPHILKKFSIPVNKITQEAGEIMITFPYGYHSGYNHGFNCAESTNFATERWIEYGKRCLQCECRKDGVRINMDCFVKRFQPERFEAWKEGKDIAPHPEGHTVIRRPSKSESKKEGDGLVSKRHPPSKQFTKRQKLASDDEEEDCKDEDYNPKKKEKGGKKNKEKKPKSKVESETTKAKPKKRKSGEQAGKASGETKPKQRKKKDIGADVVDGAPPKVEMIRGQAGVGKSHEAVTPPAKQLPAISQPTQVEMNTQTVESYLPDETVMLPKTKIEFYYKDSNAKRIPIHVQRKTTFEEEYMRKIAGMDSAEQDCRQRKSATSSKGTSGKGKKKIVAAEATTSKDNSSGICDITMPQPVSSDRDLNACSSSSSSVSTKHEQTSEMKSSKTKKKKSALQAESLTTSAAATVTCVKTKASSLSGKSGSSDEENGSSSAASGNFEHPSPWAKHLTPLWQGQAVSMAAERAYNRAMSHRPPNCAICALFKRFDIETERGLFDEGGLQMVVPARSLPMIPEMVFAISKANPTPFCDYTLLEEDGLSTLLTCTNCNVCVHASCYGVANIEDPYNWKCSRCASFSTHAECCLCLLRGGAMKPTTDGNWAHIVCALAIPEVSFVDVPSRNPVNVAKLTSGRQKLRCSLCGPVTGAHSQPSTCIQCSHGRCTQAFHVTCAYAAGVLFETSDWPYPIYCTCHKHQTNTRDKGKQRRLDDLFVGSQVIAKHKNGRYYHANIVEVSRHKQYEVDFDDGSVSFDLLPEDIVGHSCGWEGPPAVGSHIQVRWTDGELYGAVFRGVNCLDDYTVEFEDASQLVLKRAELWTEDEELPKSVKSRLSVATERKYSLFYPDQDASREGPRPKKKIDYVAMLAPNVS